MKKNQNNNFLLYSEFYNFYLNLYPYFVRFPRSEKFTLRLKIDETALEMLIILDKFIRLEQRDKLTQLKKISYLFDKFKLLIRLSNDLGFLGFS